MAAPLARSRPDRSPGGGADGGWPPFAALNVPGFAWEFLRRNPDYHDDYARGLADRPAGQGDIDARWGLRFPVDPALPAARAEVFWRPEVAPGIVIPFEADDRGPKRATVQPPFLGVPRRAEDGLHVRLAAGLQMLLRGDARPEGPLVVVLGFDRDFGLRVRAVEALERATAGRAAPRSRLTAAQRLRLVRSLLALDGALRHDSYRQIAQAVFGAEAVDREDWRTASVRDATIRLVRTGRALMRGGYLKLLKGGL
jgi:hypothetical protein